MSCRARIRLEHASPVLNLTDEPITWAMRVGAAQWVHPSVRALEDPGAHLDIPWEGSGGRELFTELQAG